MSNTFAAPVTDATVSETVDRILRCADQTTLTEDFALVLLDRYPGEAATGAHVLWDSEPAPGFPTARMNAPVGLHAGRAVRVAKELQARGWKCKGFANGFDRGRQSLGTIGGDSEWAVDLSTASIVPMEWKLMGSIPDGCWVMLMTR